MKERKGKEVGERREEKGGNGEEGNRGEKGGREGKRQELRRGKDSRGEEWGEESMERGRKGRILLLPCFWT